MIYQPEELMHIVDQCAIAMRDQGQDVEECLARHPDRRDALEPLLLVTQRLQAARTVTAPADFRRVAGTRMQNLIAAHPRRDDGLHRPVSAPTAWWQKLRLRLDPAGTPLLIRLAAILLATFLIGTATVYAAGDAAPDDILYPVKQAVETVQLGVTLDNARDIRLHLTFATRRLREAETLLAEGGDTNLFRRALAQYQEHIDAALRIFRESDSLTAAVREELLAEMMALQDAHDQILTRLAQESPPGWLEAVDTAMDFARQFRNEIHSLLDDATLEESSVPPPVPTEEVAPIVSEDDKPTATPTPYPSATSESSAATPPPVHTPPWPTDVPPPPEWLYQCIPPEWWEWPNAWPDSCPPPDAEEWDQLWEWLEGLPTPPNPLNIPTPELPDIPDIPDPPDVPDPPDIPDPPNTPVPPDVPDPPDIPDPPDVPDPPDIPAPPSWP